jgi:DNA-binding CsgD family transcriptional regulator
VLLGRHREREALDRLLASVRSGESRVLVLRGEPGVGKSALLGYVRERASGCRVVRAVGVQSEMELAYAGLHQLSAPMLDRLDRLPGPQRDALATAFGLSAGEAPDPFLVCLAALSLLSEMAEERPLVCLVDDAQWLDRASTGTLAFVARRLLAESVGMVFATREASEVLKALPGLLVEGLPNDEAGRLLHSVVSGVLDEQVRARIVAETRGNPLALLELPRGLTPAELAGGFGLPDPRALPTRIEESFRRRLGTLPDGTQRVLLVAAAEPVGDPRLVWRAAQRIGVGIETAAPATDAGLVEFGTRVRFRHPLVRSAVYRSASPEDRRRVHSALAEATDPVDDPDRRAWHRAQAATGPDDDVAAELERSAGRAQARGGLAAAAAFLEQAAALTLDPAHRATRALAAAQAKHQAGAPDAALALLGTAETGRLDELGRARVQLLRGQIAFAVRRGSDAPPLLLDAARRFEPLDVRLARETYLDALAAALFAGRFAGGVGLLEVAKAARAAPASSDPPRALDLLLNGWVLLITEGYAAAAPMLKRAVGAFHRGEDISRDEEIRWLWLAYHTGIELWDDYTLDVLSRRHVQLAREAGALAVLPIALQTPAITSLFAGDPAAATSRLEEAEAVAEAIGSERPTYAPVVLAACRGREAEAAELIEASVEAVTQRGEGVGLAVIQWASAMLYNGLGRYEDAVLAAQRATESPHDPPRALSELIEAAVRCGKTARAAEALRRLSESTRAGGTQWGLGIEAQSRALLSERDAADGFYREAIERLGGTRVRIALARAHLLYGEWLRRENRRADAREQLRTAYEMLSSMRIDAFAERARHELLATGETARKRTIETHRELTAQEARIARLAGDGLSNPEIGARLFISPRTVEYHLRKVFTKLDIRSRSQLDRALSSDAEATTAV